MLNICYSKGLEIDVMLNAKKSTLFVVGKVCDVEIGCLQIGSDCISWCTQMKYSNICNHSHFASEITKLFLLQTFYLPLISYSCEALNYNRPTMQLDRLICIGIMLTENYLG